MGRIKTKKVKAVSNEIFAEHRQDFKTDFDQNKEVVDKLIKIPSKKLRNEIVGYVTRMAKEKR